MGRVIEIDRGEQARTSERRRLSRMLLEREEERAALEARLLEVTTEIANICDQLVKLERAGGEVKA